MKKDSSKLTKLVIAKLSLHGIRAWRQNTVGVWDPVRKIYRKHASQIKGVSDVIGYQRGSGRFVAVEIKTGKDRLSQEQRAFLIDVADAGGISIVANTYEQFINQLTELL